MCPLKLTLSPPALVADVVGSLLKTQITLGNISFVLLNLIKIFTFVMFKDFPLMLALLTLIFSF